MPKTFVIRCASTRQVATDELSERNGGQVKYIILDLSPVTHIDTTALHVLDDMYTTQKKLGVQMCYCNPGISVMQETSQEWNYWQGGAGSLLSGSDRCRSLVSGRYG